MKSIYLILSPIRIDDNILSNQLYCTGSLNIIGIKLNIFKVMLIIFNLQ